MRSALGKVALANEVEALRCGLDAAAWWRPGARCVELTSQKYTNSDYERGNALPFDPVRAHKLYMSLLGQVEDLLHGRKLLLVPSGALTMLPFQVLVTKAPTSPDLASASWLIREHAITVLPSVASLVALRRTGNPSTASKPLIGFANPLLDGDQENPKDGTWHIKQAERARSVTKCPTLQMNLAAERRVIGRKLTSVRQLAGLADLAHLKRQTPLPETADEVCNVARSIGADVGEMRIGSRATETEVKELSKAGELAKFGILHFATHGTLAGQLSGTSEPGLILTPPAAATPEDDGFLSASEIGNLKLDAEWIILSACNTAGGAGHGEAAEALSGLARAFFYAGARALLVSHWEVDTNAAINLVTGSVDALTENKGLGRAHALRRAMLAMIDAGKPHEVHPSYWAPFVVVGEDGAGR